MGLVPEWELCSGYDGLLGGEFAGHGGEQEFDLDFEEAFELKHFEREQATQRCSGSCFATGPQNFPTFGEQKAVDSL